MNISKIKNPLLTIFLVIIFLPVFLPQLDLKISSLFYLPEKGFYLANDSIFSWIHWLVPLVAWGVGSILICGLIFTALCRNPAYSKYRKRLSFLVLVLVIGTGLVVNLGLKDHWGRSRPVQIVEFGGTETFTPALIPHFEKARDNGSFVCGDGAFGFFMISFGYVVPLRFSRFTFFLGAGIGVIFSISRIVMGGHFFSDAVCAALVMFLVANGIHLLMFGKEETVARLQLFFAGKDQDAGKGKTLNA
jgi:lipid A 4'-phosphatase